MSDARPVESARRVLSMAVAVLGVLGVLAASPVDATLARYTVRSSSVTVEPDFSQSFPQSAIGTAIVEDDGGGFPKLRKLVTVSDLSTTLYVPACSGFIWISRRFEWGPADDQTGSGAISSSVEWGTLEGWTQVGGSFCNAVPESFCGLGGLQLSDDETIPAAPLASNRYDVGSWWFHGTGFVGDPFVFATLEEGGFSLWVPRGAADSAVIPALPLLGVVALAGALVATGVTAVRGRKS